MILVQVSESGLRNWGGAFYQPRKCLSGFNKLSGLRELGDLA